MNTKIQLLRRATLGLSLSAFILAPVAFSATAAQADPPRHAPAWGYRDKDDRRDDKRERKQEKREDKRERREDRRDDRRDDRNDNRPQYLVLTGTVVTDMSGNQFTLRTSRGTFRVVNSNQGRRVSRGDYVRISGTRSGNLFYARDVDILRDR